MEKHVQSVLAGLVLASLLWVGAAVTESRVEIAALKERLEQISRRMDEAAANRLRDVAGRYTSSDAQRDLALRDQRIRGMEERVTRLEKNSQLARIGK